PFSLGSSRSGPVGRLGSTYVAFSFVTTVRASPVSVWVTVTVTPGSTAPLWYVMRPLNCAVESCAQAAAAETRTESAPISGIRNWLIQAPFQEAADAEFRL